MKRVDEEAESKQDHCWRWVFDKFVLRNNQVMLLGCHTRLSSDAARIPGLCMAFQDSLHLSVDLSAQLASTTQPPAIRDAIAPYSNLM